MTLDVISTHIDTMDVDESGADVAAMEDVPPPPAPVAGPSARRARVQLPEHHDDDGPTYYRLGVDYPVDPEDDEVLHQCARIKFLGLACANLPRLRQLGLSFPFLLVLETLKTLTRGSWKVWT